MDREHRNHSKSTLRLCKIVNSVGIKFTSSKKTSKTLNIIDGRFFIVPCPGQFSPCKSASVQIYSRTKVDPETGKGKLSKRARLKHGRNIKKNGVKITTYKAKFHVEPEFGIPGAFVINNRQNHEFFLRSATFTISTDETTHFDCNSWVYPIRKTKKTRIFFSNTSFVPNQTPRALWELRKEELTSLRGNGTGERKEWDRVYDYDLYNDLGNPEKGPEHSRPILGGSQSLPYPRRIRTGRPLSNADSLSKRQLKKIFPNIHVPPDERISPEKFSELLTISIRAIAHFLSFEIKYLSQQDSNSFQSFDEINNMFSRNKSNKLKGKVTEKLKRIVPDKFHKQISHAIKEISMRYPLPGIIADNLWAWKDDEEFGRQMLAGTNPTRIKGLESFPPSSKYGFSSIKVSDIEGNLDGLTLEEAMNQWRIFLLDHHDYLVPFLNRINKRGACAYASRTLLFLRDDDTLKPIAIELTLPDSSDEKEINRVFLPSSQGTEAALWQLAKAHVAANDSGYHHLISHWLHTHAVVEPFIIATRRQLSKMHPVHRLLDPHFKDRLHMNTIFRSVVLNCGGILEKTLFTSEISMELSAELYKEWKLDEQGLPADLLKRGMAFEDPDKPAGIQLLFQDYPYGADGLEIWIAIDTWVREFCLIFYNDDDSVKFDEEIQAWWSEIRNVGHCDKNNETWWYGMTTLTDLVKALTTLIWIASALHASVNSGQYQYAAYPPNRPTKCRCFIPQEGSKEFAEFLINPDKFYINMLPQKLEAGLGVALIEVLSHHTSDELHLGQRLSPDWTDHKEVQKKFEKFNNNLREIKRKIMDRNRDPTLKNRFGPAKIPYNIMCPDISITKTKGKINGKGTPNSISI